MGVTKEFIASPVLILTDYADHPWVDMKVDAMAMPFENESVDVLIANNVIHHVAYPLKLFREARRVLKPGGRFLIQEINGSFLMRFILRVMRHEGYSLRQNPFDETKPCNDPRDLWSANCALANLLFDNADRFERENPGLRIEMQKYSEVLIFPLSGGVIAKSPTLELPESILKVIDQCDEWLVKMWPRFFALQRKIVLKKSRTLLKSSDIHVAHPPETISLESI